MHSQTLIIGVLCLVLAVSCNNSSHKEPEDVTTEKVTTEKEMEDLKTIAQKAQTAFFADYSEEDMKKYFNPDYIQHNPFVPTGIEPVLGFLPTLKEANTTCTTHRLLQDGDFVVFHNSYDNAEAFGAKEMVTFDIYRIEDRKVAEHWDATTPKVTETASGRSQTDGPTKIEDIEKTAENKLLIKNFMNDVMMGENPSKITEYISSTQYDQHNTAVKDGLEGLTEAIEYLKSQDNMFIYNKVHRILGEGNFVLTQSEGEWNGKPQSLYDLFRISDGKIVEHWDVIQEIPSEMAHANGMF